MTKLLTKIFKNDTPLLVNQRFFVTDEIIGTTLLVADAFIKRPGNYVVIASNLFAAQKILSSLQTFVTQEHILFYPNDDLLHTEIISASKQFEAQRIYALFAAQDKTKHHIYVTNLSAALKPTVKVKKFQDKILNLALNDKLTIDQMIEYLNQVGYQRVGKIEQTMQYAVRGDIVDVFSVNEDNPTRIEFFDDYIESIRTFNIATQITVNKIEHVTIIPATEVILTNDETTSFFNDVISEAVLSKNDFTQEDFEELKNNIFEDFELHKIGNNLSINKYLSLSHVFSNSFVDHVHEPQLILANENQLSASFEILQEQGKHFLFEQQRNNKAFKSLKLYRPYEILNKYPKVLINEFADDNNYTRFAVNPVVTPQNINDLPKTIDGYLEDNNKVYLSVNNNSQLKQLESVFKEADFSYGLSEENDVVINFDYFANGFAIPSAQLIVLTSKELFNISRNEARYNARFKIGTIIRSHEQLVPGDFVVHEYHGIGQYVDVETLFTDGVNKDFIKIQYAGSDALFIPLEQIQLIRKYSGREGVAPRLHRLGSVEWKKTKQRLKERINDIADKLIEIQATRMKTPGFAYPVDDEFQNEFELRFPYELTVDQKQALIEIKQDMEQPYIMDRLLCGDVGFGKTEIAFRSIFKAISAGKQVMLLCPTTLLARQHLEVALERFEDFGVKIGMISRLVTTKEKTRTIKRFNEGQIHLLIGTHSLLNLDLKNVNLGLLVVDEEQRFGVEQKEKIKEFKSRTDVLTLSATPIPRTLQMALVGIRGLSQINTAPQERMPIQTYVIRRDDYVVKELIDRELQRGGQVFYLYNRIETIYQIANRLNRLVPSARVGVVHGQMDRNEVEDVMVKFYNNDINVLVATSIIENGIDVPNANVIIVDHADRFGLSQLYQIKGRVGRGHRIAYAYLMYNHKKVMNENAKKRLKAIQEFTDLGSGYKIAQRDLMIRGAGDILGAEQSGFIDTVGIDMYLKMLQDTVNEKKYNLESEQIEQSVNLIGVEAYIPDSFATKADKFDIYLEIKQAKKLTTLRETEQKILDMYGHIPPAVATLFTKRQIELMVNSKVKYVDSVSDEIDYIDIVPGKTFTNIPGSMVKLSNDIGSQFTNIRIVSQDGKMKLRVTKKGPWFEAYSTIVRSIVAIVRGYIKDKNAR